MEQALFSETADQKVDIELYCSELTEMCSRPQQPDGVCAVTKGQRKNSREESSEFMNHLTSRTETKPKAALKRFWKGIFT